MKTKTPYHFIGIGGIGMSGLARILLHRGHRVSGTDISHSPLLKELQELGAIISIGHNGTHVPEKATLIYSSSIDPANPEVVVAKEKMLPIMHRSELLKSLMEQQKSLLVTGTHGKTTITTLLTHLLKVAGKDPGFAIGGIASAYSTNAGHGEGEYFVAEADESDGSFLRYNPFGAIISNVDLDHLDHYKNENALLKAFQEFADKVQNHDLLLYCKDDPGLHKISIKGTSYGFTPEANVRGDHFRQKGMETTFDVFFKGKTYKDFTVALPGKHSALNALGVIGMGLQLGISESVIRKAMKSYSGAKRRVEMKANENGVIIYDDYGHHPTEIECTLKGLKGAYPHHKLLVYFQPHRYSRTKDCLKEFGPCFDWADEVVITDIYAAGEAALPGIHAKLILDEVLRSSSVKASYVPQEELLDDAQKRLDRFTVVVTLGAGDITQLGAKINLKPVKKLKLALLFGGRSSEHEISLRSAKNIFKELDRAHFDVVPFFITKKGKWVSGAQATAALNGDAIAEPESYAPLAELAQCDVVFPVLHGLNGEDGTMQGFLEILSLPYAGCDCFSSAATMDKATTKKLAQFAGLKVAPFLHFHAYEWRRDPKEVMAKIKAQFKGTCYVKPVHLGSTIGITKVASFEDMPSAIHKAVQYDEEFLVEQEIKGREVEFALFGNEELVAFPPGEIMSQGGVYGYEEKYLSNAMETIPKASLSSSQIERGIQFVKKAYRALGCNGYARVDCFLENSGDYVLNEINTIPGFTDSSLYPQMAASNGWKTKDLLTELLLIGLERSRKKERKRL